ncbi:MAG TPA: YCF48-related protein, partial [Solirubrobacteraceae bacterium]
AGDFGTLLRTDDAGATWSGLPAGTYTGLTEVQAIDGDSLFAAGGCVARRSDDGGRTFRRVAFTPVESSCREQLAAGWFVDERTGYLVLTDGTVLRTDNDGDTFAQATALPATRAQGGQARPTDIEFTSASTGVAATSDGKLYRTTDAGTSWALVNATERAVRDVLFLDPANGFAVGEGSLLLRTSDGGATWTPRALAGSTATLTSIRCATALLCAMTTERGDQLVRTTDGGDTATLVTPSPDPVHAAAFASATRIVAAGEQGSTAVSDDAGVNFAPVGGRLSGALNRVVAGLQAGSAFAPGDNGTLAKTVDGGRTWTRGNVSTSEDVLDVAFPTTSAGFALDTAGGLFRTTDGGASWKTLDTGTTARPAAVAAPSPSTVLLAGPLGIRRSTDAGEVFEAVRGRLVATARLRALDRAGSALVAWGNAAILRSLDRGRTWQRIPRPGATRRSTGRLIADADFITARLGYVLGADGTLYVTRNAGRSYVSLPGVGTEMVRGMSFP